MNKINEETLSALMDNEVSDFELRRFLQDLEVLADDEKSKLLDKWQYLNIISNEIKKINDKGLSKPVFYASPNFHQKIKKNISDCSRDQSDLKWKNLAVAASFALVTIISLQKFGPYQGDSSKSFIVDSNSYEEKTVQFLNDDSNQPFLSPTDLATSNESTNLKNEEEKQDELHELLLKKSDSISEKFLKKNAQHANFEEE